MVEVVSTTIKLSTGKKVTLTEQESVELLGRLDQLFGNMKVYYPVIPACPVEYPKWEPDFYKVTNGESTGDAPPIWSVITSGDVQGTPFLAG